MKKIIGILLSFLALLSCSKELSTVENTVIGKNSRYLSMEEASYQALQLYSELFGEKVKSYGTPGIKDVTAVTNSTDTKSGDSNSLDTTLYVVNFSDNSGYAILMADRRSQTPIIGIADKGNLSTNEIPENSNLCAYLINTDIALSRAIVGPPTPSDTLQDIIPPEYYIEFTPWELVSYVDPLIESEWGQNYPYYLHLDQIDGQFPPVGCVATAVAQIMGYYKRPSGYDWAQLVQYNFYDDFFISDNLKNQFGTLFKTLGERLDMNYSLKGSGAPSENVPPTLRSYGYSSGELEGYSLDKIKSELVSMRPVYIDGYAIKEEVWENTFLWFGKYVTKYSEGHAWIIDGFKGLRREMQERDYETHEILKTTVQTMELVHCNFGWDGTDNGYYYDQAFDTNEGEVDVPGTNLASENPEEGESGNFQYNFHIITDIK